MPKFWQAAIAAFESIKAPSRFCERSLRSKWDMSANAHAIARSLHNCWDFTPRESDRVRQTAELGRR